ncbi:hypothetical protein SAMN05518801_10230 [Novosphingobium sp. CF614]|uniref:hypothetical protein n=1 Tax=Novosphingobium sp. CF614 TaxID=1884364 RepID=UPI0008E48971|nr:hypothetical protein [Novosphingobium sp. CF614]SFF82653.1 hypothetical protein SAMN05518801_10230 [Novosphingobium sp. CF614]
MNGLRGAVLGVLSLCLGACDSTPSADFEQQVKDREAAKAGDPYATLESGLPSQSFYVRRDKDVRRDWAAGQSGTYRATYDGLRKKLDGDKAVAAMAGDAAALRDRCRTAFAAASDFQARPAGSNAAAAGDVASALTACRDAMQRRIAEGKDKEAAATLSRFASAGVVLVGMAVVGRGEEAAGLSVWRQGNELVAKDQPGFQLNAKAFYGY